MKQNIYLKFILVFALILGMFSQYPEIRADAASKTYSATVNVSVLNVREKPSTNSKKFGSLKKGTKVTVYSKTKSGWSEIRYNKKKAYVSTKYLKFTQAVSYEKAYAAKTLVVKSSPGTSYKTLGKIKSGTTVKVYGAVPVGKDQDDWYSYEQYGWSKIKYNNKTAWVKTHELSFADPWRWTPGVKTKTINEIKKNYVSEKDKTKLEKLDPGYYIMYIKINGKGDWQQLVVINCKTGWYHG